MNYKLNHITQLIKHGIICGFVSGFCVGCFPNKLSVNFEDKKYNSLPIPLISGFIGSTGMFERRHFVPKCAFLNITFYNKT
jgi:hypothetical protein